MLVFSALQTPQQQEQSHENEKNQPSFVDCHSQLRMSAHFMEPNGWLWMKWKINEEQCAVFQTHFQQTSAAPPFIVSIAIASPFYGVHCSFFLLFFGCGNRWMVLCAFNILFMVNILWNVSALHWINNDKRERAHTPPNGPIFALAHKYQQQQQ